MNDLTQYSENELSTLVYNDEGLYRMRHRLDKELLNEFGLVFTDEQWEIFQNDLQGEDE